MDILRKELNEIYYSQELHKETLNPSDLERCKKLAESFTAVTDGCSVITDACRDRCYIFIGSIASILGISESFPISKVTDSSDEDIIYSLIHPEDIVEKRMLEYEFFKFVNSFDIKEKKEYRATCRIRIRNSQQEYVMVDNTTQIICPSPKGKIWLIMCTYSLASYQNWTGSIFPIIKNINTGEIIRLSFCNRRKHILTKREKEILRMIKDGKASKQIADLLNISQHTVNRHRQNILEKLSVANSIEALKAVDAMNLW